MRLIGLFTISIGLALMGIKAFDIETMTFNIGNMAILFLCVLSWSLICEKIEAHIKAQKDEHKTRDVE